jgi:hypothetical protein
MVPVAAVQSDEDGGFTSVPTKASNTKQRSHRIHVGNLPDAAESSHDELKAIVADKLQVDPQAIAITGHQPQHQSVIVIVSGMTADTAMTRLRGLQWRGTKLVVKKDKNIQKNGTLHQGSQPSFGAWTKPKNHRSFAEGQSQSTLGNQSPLNEHQEGTSLPNADQPLATAHETTRAAFPTPTSVTDDNAEESGPTLDFPALCQNPLSQLLDDYGEQDPDWMNVVPNVDLPGNEMALDPTPVANDRISETSPRVETMSRLERHGKAPIHVELVSFGYRHGIPSQVRDFATGHSHRQPLLAFDVRAVLPEVPHYLAWMDGRSGAVRNSMLRYQPNSGNNGRERRFRKSHSPASTLNATEAASKQVPATTTTWNVRDYARSVIAAPVSDALEAAMQLHGYADPLCMSIYIGSEEGRHRSVVAAEQAATALRKMLRENERNRFTCAVSVGCRHRDIDRHRVAASGRKYEED